MKTFLSLNFALLLLSLQFSSAQIPNNDFEIWEPSPWSGEQLQDWTSLYGDLLPDMIHSDSDSYSGTYSMHLYNTVLPSYAYTSFPIQEKPASLHAYVKGTVHPGDSVFIRVVLFHQSLPVDSGRWVAHTSFDQWTPLTASISKFSSLADSALIFVSGGTNTNTEVKFDLMTLDFQSGIPPSPTISFITASPNPFSDFVTLQVFMKEEFHGEVSIINSLGSKVASIHNVLLTRGEHEIFFNTASLPGGNYYCLLKSESEMARITLIKGF